MGWWCSGAVVVSYYYAISPPPWFRQFSALNLCSCTSLAAAAAHNAFQCPSKASILHLVGLQRLHLVELVVDQPFHCLPFLSSWAGFTVTNDRLDPAILLIPWNTIYIQVCSSTAVKSTWQHQTKSISLSGGPDHVQTLGWGDNERTRWFLSKSNTGLFLSKLNECQGHKRLHFIPRTNQNLI